MRNSAKNHQRTGAVGCCIAACLLLATTALAQEELSQTRHRAVLLTLNGFTPIPYQRKVFAERQERIHAFFQMLVYEGGYLPDEAARTMGVDDLPMEETARVFRILARAKGDKLVGGDPLHRRPGGLLLSCATALAYSRPSVDGLNAAAHFSRIGCDDKNTEVVARATYALMSFTLMGELDKDVLLIKVANNTPDKYIARCIRGLRTNKLDRLPSEATIEGRFLRSLFLWYHNNTWRATINRGQSNLRHGESQRFLAIFCAGWYDLVGLPATFRQRITPKKPKADLYLRLYKLADAGILIGVPDSTLAPRQVPTQSAPSTADARNAEDQQAPTPPAPPTPPEAPERPAAPVAPVPGPMTTALKPVKVAPVAAALPAHSKQTIKQKNTAAAEKTSKQAGNDLPPTPTLPKTFVDEIPITPQVDTRIPFKEISATRVATPTIPVIPAVEDDMMVYPITNKDH